MTIYDNMLDLIGHTPMIRLSRIKKDLKSTLLGKLEFYNPSGSVKDRIALYMIEDAERQGKIKPGDTIVEPTSGNTGTSLSLVCALKGYRMIAVMPNQFANPANTIAHRETTAEEIWKATAGKIDVFVAGVGTSGTAMGVSLGLKDKNSGIKVYVVEPANSAVIRGESPGYHRLQGIGEGFVPDLLEHERYDGIITVSDDEAKATTCRLSRLEGIFAGYSAGANVFASLKLAEEFGEGKTIVTIIPDSGMKYLSTELFQYGPEICIDYCCAVEDSKNRKECAKGTPSCCVLESC